MSGFLRVFCRDESGATAVEYAIIAMMIFLAIISVITNVGTHLVTIFTSVNSGFH
jgi:pilus assembly protein Flp/PilA